MDPLCKPHGDASLFHRPRRGRRSQSERAAPRTKFTRLRSKSADDVSYLLSRSASIARLCSVSDSVDFVQWATESYHTGELIYRVVGNGTEVRLTDEQVGQLQSVLQKQVVFILSFHPDLSRRKAPRKRVAVPFPPLLSASPPLPRPSSRDSIGLLGPFPFPKTALAISCLFLLCLRVTVTEMSCGVVMMES